MGLLHFLFNLDLLSSFMDNLLCHLVVATAHYTNQCKNNISAKSCCSHFQDKSGQNHSILWLKPLYSNLILMFVVSYDIQIKHILAIVTSPLISRQWVYFTITSIKLLFVYCHCCSHCSSIKLFKTNFYA